jgi:hypothetical protein
LSENENLKLLFECAFSISLAVSFLSGPPNSLPLLNFIAKDVIFGALKVLKAKQEAE